MVKWNQRVTNNGFSLISDSVHVSLILRVIELRMYLHLGHFCCRAHYLVCVGPFLSLYLHFSTSKFSVCSSYKNKVSQSKVYVSEFHPQVINVCVKVRSSLWWEWLTHWLKLALLQIFGNRFLPVYCCCIRKRVMLDLSYVHWWNE